MQSMSGSYTFPFLLKYKDYWVTVQQNSKGSSFDLLKRFYIIFSICWTKFYFQNSFLGKNTGQEMTLSCFLEIKWNFSWEKCKRTCNKLFYSDRSRVSGDCKQNSLLLSILVWRDEARDFCDMAMHNIKSFFLIPSCAFPTCSVLIIRHRQTKIYQISQPSGIIETESEKISVCFSFFWQNKHTVYVLL